MSLIVPSMNFVVTDTGKNMRSIDYEFYLTARESVHLQLRILAVEAKRVCTKVEFHGQNSCKLPKYQP